VLLGERHDSAAQHRWQLHTLAALHAHRPDIVVGMEMLPRRVQPVLDRWNAGELSEAEFLRDVQWSEVWGYDAEFYLPILRYARMNRLPVVALNVERDLVRRTGREGWAAVPRDLREGVGDPAPPPASYLDSLAEVSGMHGPDRVVVDRNDPGFRRFVEAQLVWDRAMAEGIAQAHRRSGALVVGIMGAGHVENGHGVIHQLAALGVPGALGLLPWEGDRPCEDLRPGFAEAVFGLDPEPEPAERPRLGVMLAPAEGGGLRIESVVENGIGARAGITQGDLLREAAGTPLRQTGDLVAIVRGMGPGTWLPLVVERDGRRMELVAKFPPS
jgi:uncharacterized iron-regulated protein